MKQNGSAGPCSCLLNSQVHSTAQLNPDAGNLLFISKYPPLHAAGEWDAAPPPQVQGGQFTEAAQRNW